MNAIGMRWQDAKDAAWEKYYAAAKRYYKEHGNLLVNINEKSYGGVALGKWIAQLRNYKKSNTGSAYLSPERIEALERIGMAWDVPVAYVTENGCRLGKWIRHQRDAYKSNSLSEERKKKLESIGVILIPVQIGNLKSIGIG